MAHIVSTLQELSKEDEFQVALTQCLKSMSTELTRQSVAITNLSNMLNQSDDYTDRDYCCDQLDKLCGQIDELEEVKKESINLLECVREKIDRLFFDVNYQDTNVTSRELFTLSEEIASHLKLIKE